MKATKQQLSVIATASKDSYRPVLNSVQISKKDGEIITVATDSYVLTEIRVKTEDKTNVEPMLLPVEVVKMAQSLLRAHKHVDGAEFGPEDVTVNGTTHRFKPVEGKFPDYNHIIPTADDKTRTVKVNPKLLKQVLEVFKDDSDITLEFHDGGYQPLVMRSSRYQAEKTALVMPLRG